MRRAFLVDIWVLAWGRYGSLCLCLRTMCLPSISSLIVGLRPSEFLSSQIVSAMEGTLICSCDIQCRSVVLVSTMTCSLEGQGRCLWKSGPVRECNFSVCFIHYLYSIIFEVMSCFCRLYSWVYILNSKNRVPVHRRWCTRSECHFELTHLKRCLVSLDLNCVLYIIFKE
jgi:hypothetical protein